jgi:hypothetical protein
MLLNEVFAPHLREKDLLSPPDDVWILVSYITYIDECIKRAEDDVYLLSRMG